MSSCDCSVSVWNIYSIRVDGTCYFVYSDKRCPIKDCNELVEDGDVRPDKACHRELSKLQAECKGCRQWKGNLLDIEVRF